MENKQKEIALGALFLGPKSENAAFFKELLSLLVDDHIFWRRNFNPEDPDLIHYKDKFSPNYIATKQHIFEVINELSAKLRTHSMPFHSPRYLGHMTTDTLLPALIAYMATMLYNPNNCAFEGSPATSVFEVEASEQLAKLMGYDPKKSWSHLTAGGTLANYEALWVARNLKQLPLNILHSFPEKMHNYSEWACMNFSQSDTIELLSTLTTEEKRIVMENSVRFKGGAAKIGKVLVPRTRHYSWEKMADLLGIGRENLLYIDVTDEFIIDTQALEKQLCELAEAKIPVLCVVAVVGSTEEGSVDPVHEVLALRETMIKRYGLNFTLHVDAAYGGYFRTVFLDEQGALYPYDTLRALLQENQLVDKDNPWPKRGVYEAFKAMSQADSITVDPHKAGYIPYHAAAVLYRRRDVRDAIAVFAAYVEDKEEIANDIILGSFDLMGSKAGAMAAAVWTANKILPLNLFGYGKVLLNGIEASQHFHYLMRKNPVVSIGTHKIALHSLVEPDTNIVVFAFNVVGNQSLKRMNEFNERIYRHSSYHFQEPYKNDFMTSKTILKKEEYGDSALEFIKRFGISEGEWDKISEVYVLRACILTPYLGVLNDFEKYVDKIIASIKKKIIIALKELDSLDKQK